MYTLVKHRSDVQNLDPLRFWPVDMNVVGMPLCI
jgi:hypothetical protein